MSDSNTTDAEGVFRRLLTAIVERDWTAVLALYREDAVVRQPFNKPEVTLHGKAEPPRPARP